jgi:hypothetical protein
VTRRMSRTHRRGAATSGAKTVAWPWRSSAEIGGVVWLWLNGRLVGGIVRVRYASGADWRADCDLLWFDKFIEVMLSVL